MPDESTLGHEIEIGGRVQGVGFRPFVYGLATELNLKGDVCNRLGTVRVRVVGDVNVLREFETRVIRDAPPLSRPSLLKVDALQNNGYAAFSIQDSDHSDEAKIFVPPDYFACSACLDEMHDPDNRRFRYPFINCTQCGPRYTLIKALPYDRVSTSMSEFPLCAQCHAEYSDPRDRRFHAEPIACPACGPQLRFVQGDEAAIVETQAALRAAVSVMQSGNILAVKGIGGYHLMCDARNPAAIQRLRNRKARPDKPLAVMMPLGDGDQLVHARQYVNLAPEQAKAIRSPARPIVLVGRKMHSRLAPNIAPGLDEIGVFLPYSPLHALLLGDFGGPLVATSGNVSGEPVLTDNAEAEARLYRIADAFLHHDRGIVRPADDPVLRQIGETIRPLRQGRGTAPLEIDLPCEQAEPVLCVGGQQKTTVTLSWGRRAVVSPHIGEMTSPRSQAVFERVANDLQSLYGVEAKRIICDAHPGYATTRWARQQPLPLESIWHHHAHASALVAELALPGRGLVFAWDGVGLGEDGSLWGGEALYGMPGQWRRVASFRTFTPPGGDRVAREPWRSAAALCWGDNRPVPFVREDLHIARNAWQKNLNCPATSAVGRLFDAAAAIILGIQTTSFEAQGPMLLEAACERAGSSMHLPLSDDGHGVLRTDWAPLLPLLHNAERSAARRAEDFHATMANTVLDQAVALRTLHAFDYVGLTGGVFQNHVLAEQVVARLEDSGFTVHLASLLPSNDAAISFGQAAEWAAQQCRKRAD